MVQPGDGVDFVLEAGDFAGFTDTFEDLHGLAQLPGLAVQRLMRDGYGFGAEGDWKTSALVRAMKGWTGSPRLRVDLVDMVREQGEYIELLRAIVRRDLSTRLLGDQSRER